MSVCSPFARSIRGTAVLLALLATLSAVMLKGGAPGISTAFDSIPYDAWLRLREPAPANPSIVVVTRNAASEARFGAGPWDTALFARVITALSRVGAKVVGIDLPLDPANPPRGGPASDAILVDATRRAGRVVYPLSVQLQGSKEPDHPQRQPGAEGHGSWPVLTPEQAGSLLQANPFPSPWPAVAQRAAGLGHDQTPADDDGVIRRVPLYVAMNEHAIPAFGVALVAAFLEVSPERVTITPGRAITLHDVRFGDGPARALSIPVDVHGRMLLSSAEDTRRPTAQSLSFVEVWEAIEQGQVETLRDWVAGKLVLIVPTAHTSAEPRTSVGNMTSYDAVHLRVVTTIFEGQWIRGAPAWVAIMSSLVLSGLAAALLLSVGGWIAPVAIGGLAAGYLTVVVLTVSKAALLLPLFVPLLAIALASGGAMLWTHGATRHRIRQLETERLRVRQDLAAAREALVRRESIVEGLEEDMDAARAAVTRSAGKAQESVQSAEALRVRLADAHALEERTRTRLQQLEQDLLNLRAVQSETGRLGDEEHECLRQESLTMGILTRDTAVLGIFRDLKKGARSTLPVLILGEPGTGKELFARAVHRLSPRAAQPFIPVNMAAISPDLVESELFGHVRGSFTGALGDRKGYFEQAHRGTMFLDEIGDLRLEQQGKLLRVLQDKTFHRIGDAKLTTIDVRVVAATNKDLERGVIEGWFREDLYFRLKGLVLRLPALRERARDIAVLAERFVRDAARQEGREHVALSQEALAALQSQTWKGNIRELHHTIEQAVALADGPVIMKADLRLVGEGSRAASPVSTPAAIPSVDATGDAGVLACLRRHQFDMQATARDLGWDRSTVTQRLKGMGFRALVEAGDHSKAALGLAGDPALARTVEVKLLDYYRHLMKTVEAFHSTEEAVSACRKRFKNLPDRHFHFVECLIRDHFEGKAHPSL